MSTIKSVISRRVWDSRGNPTVEVDVVLRDGAFGRAIAPAGASRGKREALDLRDGGAKLRGLDVQSAIRNVTELIGPKISGRDAADQKGIDRAILELDASESKREIGGNAAIATSLAVLHAAAASAGKPLWRHIADHYERTPSIPLPEIQIFGGGVHAGQRIDIQDFMIMVPGASDFDEVMELTNEVYFAAGAIMEERGRLAGVSDEGGWWPNFDSNEDALETLVMAIERIGETPGDRIVVSLDIAASEFCKNGVYRLSLDDKELDSGEMIEMLAKWLDKYPIVSIEDPLAEDDHVGMREFTRRFGGCVQIIGDDYLVTNSALVSDAINRGACNAVLIKVNQIGTVTEAIDALLTAEDAGWRCIVSARSGESEDVSISHLSVGLGSGQLKVGSFTRSERTAKWNECLRIQSEIGDAAFVGGTPLFNTWWHEHNGANKR